MALNITENKLLPIRRDGQTPTTSIIGSFSIGCGSTYTGSTGVSGAACLDELLDVEITSPSNAQVLMYTGSTWCNMSTTDICANLTEGQILMYTGGTICSVPYCTGSGGGASALNDLTDVVISSPASGHILIYTGSTWCNKAGIDISTNLDAGQLLWYTGSTITGMSLSSLSASHYHCNLYNSTSIKACTMSTGLCVCGDINIPSGCFLRLNTNAAIRQNGSTMQFGWICTQGNYFYTGVADPFLGLYKCNSLTLGVDTSGNVYIPSTKCLFVGKTTGDTKIDVCGDVKASGSVSASCFVGSGAGHCHCNLYNSTSIKAVTTAGGLCVCGCAWATDYVASSDCRCKKDIMPIYNAISVVDRLQGVYYKLCNDETEKCRMGMIAQNVAKVIPEVVYAGEDGMLGIDYAKIVPVLVEAIHQLQKEITNIKTYGY